MSIDLFVDLKLGHSPFLEASARCPFCSDCGWLAILGGALSVRNRFQESASLIACGVALAGE